MTVFGVEVRGVSIWMQGAGFLFLLTCFAGSSGRCAVAQRMFRLEGSYKHPAIADISPSEFIRDLRWLTKPLARDALHANRPE